MIKSMNGYGKMPGFEKMTTDNFKVKSDLLKFKILETLSIRSPRQFSDKELVDKNPSHSSILGSRES